MLLFLFTDTYTHNKFIFRDFFTDKAAANIIKAILE